MRHGIALAVLVLAAMTAAAPAWAQGYDKASGGGATAVSGRQVLTAASDRYELLLKSDALGPGMRTDLDLYLSDFQTNAPVAGVAITLSLRAGSRELWSGTARPAERRPGVYTAAFQAPADTGSFIVLATVQRGGDQDRFALSGLKVTTEEPVGRIPSRRSLPWPWIVGAAVLVLITLTTL